MRKFTKEISVLLATAAIGAAASAGNVSASTEENLMSSEGVLTISDEEINDVPVAGGLMADPYLHEEITTEPTSEELLPPTAGEPMPPDYLIEPTSEEIPPLAGDVAVVDGYIEPTTEEFLPPTAGVPMLPDDIIEPTNEWLPPTAGAVADPDGDINADGSINMADLVMLQKWLFNKEGCDDCEMWRADFTHDGVINVFDLVALRQEIVRSKKIITMDDIRELAKKGFDLKVSDFDKYISTDVGSGIYINQYEIAGTDEPYELLVGYEHGNDPLFVHLVSKRVKEEIDIRDGDIDEFLKLIDSGSVKQKITMTDIIELSKKGFDLKVSDFDKYQYTDIGSGLCINNYDIADGNGRFEFIVGHAGDDKIVYARLKGKSSGETIDIREEDVEFFYAKNNPPA